MIKMIHVDQCQSVEFVSFVYFTMFVMRKYVTDESICHNNKQFYQYQSILTENKTAKI